MTKFPMQAVVASTFRLAGFRCSKFLLVVCLRSRFGGVSSVQRHIEAASGGAVLKARRIANVCPIGVIEQKREQCRFGCVG